MKTVERLDACAHVLRQEYLRRPADPWVLAYSGGKDSTLLLQLTWELLVELPKEMRRREVHVVGNDTLVESPPIIRHLRTTLEALDAVARETGLPMKTRMTRPHIDQTFWVNVIGRGYIPPTRNFRWCTDRMKILPTSQLLEGLVQRYGRAVLLIGTRRSESVNRRRTMDRRGVSSTVMNAHSTIAGCRVFAPLADLSDQDVWLILMQREAPWGGSHRRLVTLYRNAGGDECPLVLTPDDAPSCGTSSPRFGCWTCTVVAKDRSMRGVIDSGHEDAAILEKLFDFREWLIQLREDDANRQRVRRDGNVRTRPDGSRVLGPFTLDIRKRILDRLRMLETEIGRKLVTRSECEVIEDIWRRDRIIETCRTELNDSFISRKVEVPA